MKITQISIFLENRKGRLYEVCSLLGANDVNIRALTIAETESFGVLRIVVDKSDVAIKLLRDNHFVANFTEVVAIEVPDQPGGLASILKILAENDANVEYMYGFVEKFTDKALLVMRFEDTDFAQQILAKHNIHVVAEKDIQGL